MVRIQLMNNIEEVRLNIKIKDLPKIMYMTLEIHYSRGYIEVIKRTLNLMVSI